MMSVFTEDNERKNEYRKNNVLEKSIALFDLVGPIDVIAHLSETQSGTASDIWLVCFWCCVNG